MGSTSRLHGHVEGDIISPRYDRTFDSHYRLRDTAHLISPNQHLLTSNYWGEPERDPHDAVYGDFVCLSVMLAVCTYVHIPYILVF